MKYSFFICIILFPKLLLGQEVDSYSNNNDTANVYTDSWNSLSLRTGLGIQKSFYIEIGPSWVFNSIDSRFGFGNSALYATIEWVPSTDIYGVKIGGEFGQNLFMGGIELKFLTDNKNQDFVITPKYGIGLGFVNIYYGYNFSTNKYPFSSLSKSQFSIVLNLTNKYFKEPLK